MSKLLHVLIIIRTRFDVWGVRVAALLTAGMGAVNLISAVTPALRNRLALIEDTLPLEVRYGSRMTAALAGFALFLLAGSLWRRKRTGWLLTVILLAISVVTHLIKGLDYEEASLAFGLMIILLLLRPSFHAYTDRPSLRQGLLILAAAFAFTLIYGAIGFYFLDHHFSVNFSLLAALQQTVTMFISFYNPGLEPITGFGRYFAYSIYVVGLTTLTYALVMLIRPVLVRQPATFDEHIRAEKIVKAHGHTALARPALFDDKSYFFSPGGTVIAYVARGRGAMALGDPIGPPEDVAAAITGFRDLCGYNDWTPAFVSVLPDNLDSYRIAGFDILCMGQEAIIDLNIFTLEGSAYKNVRNAVTKMVRLGYRAEMHMPPLGYNFLHELRAVSDEWLTMRRGGEMHFSDGWFDDDYIRHSPVMAIHAANGEITAFANLIPEYQKNEASLDLMRRRREIENGTMELLFTSLLEWAKGQGYASFSLGLGALSGIGKSTDDPQVEKALLRLSEYFKRFINFRGLHSFKEKFNPCWEPRYLAYPGTSSLPNVLATLLRVHSGDNFLWRYIKK
jgi:phosphatidylglycerol lysyltransferase